MDQRSGSWKQIHLPFCQWNMCPSSFWMSVTPCHPKTNKLFDTSSCLLLNPKARISSHLVSTSRSSVSESCAKSTCSKTSRMRSQKDSLAWSKNERYKFFERYDGSAWLGMTSSERFNLQGKVGSQYSSLKPKCREEVKGPITFFPTAISRKQLSNDFPH